MAGTSFGVLDNSNPGTSDVGASKVWPGGVGEIGMTGTQSTKLLAPVSVIIEDDVSGEFKPTGISITSVDERIQFEIPATKIRARLSGGDAGTSLEPFFA